MVLLVGFKVALGRRIYERVEALMSVFVCADPKQWNETNVAHWLCWAIGEFSLEGIIMHQFQMKGKDICAMGKEAFLARAPPFMGDILWEHLEILQKGWYEC
jgi:c-ets proto-oncogene protein